MSESKTKRKRSEDDLMVLLQRYSVPTILSLLQEVSEYTSKHSDSVKIDWNTLVKNTSTGISNAREYQMLWRNLAYLNPLFEKDVDGSEVVDDDSDLELELEAIPALKPEELEEVKECAKVLISSGAPRICAFTPRPVAESSSNVDTHNDQALLDPLDKLVASTCEKNMVASVSNQKQPSSTNEGLDGNGQGSSVLPGKKKRQLWTKEEDQELIAAVKKCGEGNWANILKGDFKHNRTASQLSQRWALIRKRLGNSNPCNGNKTNSTARVEERLAAQKAFAMAVDMPINGSISSIFSGATHTGNSSTSTAATSQASRACAAQSLNQLHDKGTSNLFIKTRPTLKKPVIPSIKPSSGPNPLIQAAAFAAGGRIANPSTAASLFKAAQSRNAVHIRPGLGSCLPMSSTVANNKPSSSTQAIRPSSTQPSPASFGTTLSSQRSVQPPLSTCTTASDSKVEAVQGANSVENTASESKVEAVQGPNSVENTLGKRSVGNDVSETDAKGLSSEGETKLSDAISKGFPSSESQTVVEKEKALVDEKALSESVDMKDEHVDDVKESCAQNTSGTKDSKSPMDGQLVD